MRHRSPLAVVAASVTRAVSLVLGACGKPAPKGPALPSRPHSAWTAEEAQLFDDGIDVGAIPPGDAPPSRDEANEDRIPARVDTADGVVIAKGVGVSSEPMGDRKRYRIELAQEGEPLAGASVPVPFTLSLEPDAPAYGTIRSQDAKLIGRKLVVFFKRYAPDPEEDAVEAITHFHLSPASAAVLDAIKLHKARRQFD